MTFLSIPIKIRNEMEQRMADLFLMYDFLGNSMIDNAYVSNILRFLGCVPSDKEISEFIKICRIADIEDQTHLVPFMANLTNWLEEERMKPASLQTLVDGFALLDVQQKGFITEAELVGYLNDYGEPITDAEKKILLASAYDRINQVCPLDNYIYKIYYNPKDCIYKLAAELKELRETENAT